VRSGADKGVTLELIEKYLHPDKTARDREPRHLARG
jgi:hypothetical protein